MPLESGQSKEVFSRNVAREVNAGKPVKQAVAIAYAKKRGDAADCDAHNPASVIAADDGVIAGTTPTIDPRGDAVKGLCDAVEGLTKRMDAYEARGDAINKKVEEFQNRMEMGKKSIQSALNRLKNAKFTGTPGKEEKYRRDCREYLEKALELTEKMKAMGTSAAKLERAEEIGNERWQYLNWAKSVAKYFENYNI